VPSAPLFSLILDAAEMGSHDFDADGELERMDRQGMDLANPDFDPYTLWLNPRMLDGHVSRPCHMFAGGWREERQGEWIPREMMEPRASTVRYPFN
jgi:hypothetical protein